MKRSAIALALLAGCSAALPPPQPHVGHWSSPERREAVHFTDGGQILLQRDGKEQLALGSFTAPRAEVKWDQSTATKDLSLGVEGDQLTVTLGGSRFGFRREPARPPADPRIVGLWQHQDFERRDFTSYGCVITSFKGGGVKVGDYSVQNGELKIVDRRDPRDVTALSYTASGETLSLGTSTLRRIKPEPWR